MATSSFVKAGALAGLVLLAACGGEDKAVREDHRAFQATEHAVTFLSLARDADGRGELLACWREGSEHGDVIAWTDPFDGSVPTSEVTLGPADLDWILTPLLPLQSGFARLALGTGQFGELRLGAAGEVEGYRPVFELADVAPPFQGVALSTSAAVVAAGLTGLQLWVPVELDWRVTGLVGGNLCQSNLSGDPLPFVAAAVPPDGVLVVDLEGQIGACRPWLHLVSPSGGLEEIHEELTGTLIDPETLDPTWSVVDLEVLGTGAIGVLWLSVDGRLRVHVLSAPAGFDLDTPTFDAGGAEVIDARLLASDDRFVVTYRLVQADGLSHTQAVVLHPDGPDVSAPFRWPVDDAECADLVALPSRGGVEYACVADCQGAGCRERWIYRGRVVLH